MFYLFLQPTNKDQPTLGSPYSELGKNHTTMHRLSEVVESAHVFRRRARRTSHHSSFTKLQKLSASWRTLDPWLPGKATPMATPPRSPHIWSRFGKPPPHPPQCNVPILTPFPPVDVDCGFSCGWEMWPLSLHCLIMIDVGWSGAHSVVEHGWVRPNDHHKSYMVSIAELHNLWVFKGSKFSFWWVSWVYMYNCWKQCPHDNWWFTMNQTIKFAAGTGHQTPQAWTTDILSSPSLQWYHFLLMLYINKYSYAYFTLVFQAWCFDPGPFLQPWVGTAEL